MRRSLSLLSRQVAWRRLLSNVPESTVYGGPRPQESSAARRVTVTTLRGKHRRGEPITVVTAYDYPSAVTTVMGSPRRCFPRRVVTVTRRAAEDSCGRGPP